MAVTGSLGAITGAITQQSLLVDLQGGSGSGDSGDSVIGGLTTRWDYLLQQLLPVL